MPGPKALTMPLIDVPSPIAAAKAAAADLALDDQRRERDHVADREAVDGAADEQHGRVLALQKHEQRRRLARHRRRAGEPRIEPVDEQAERQAADHRHRRHDGDRKAAA